MGVEIERKFLVKQELWATVNSSNSIVIRQAYLSDHPDKTIRVRTAGNKGYLTIKGMAKGITRAEYEWEIPAEEAHELIDHFCTDVIEKTRHFVFFQQKRWEVDEFRGSNQGLLVAEIELQSEDENFEKPVWIGEEVTHDIRYLNSQLIKNPYQQWPK